MTWSGTPRPFWPWWSVPSPAAPAVGRRWVAAGPPPQGLTQYHIRVAGAGDVELLTAPVPITNITPS